MKSKPNTGKEKLRKEIFLPDDLDARIDGQAIVLKAKDGEVKRVFKQKNISLKMEGKKIILESGKGTKEDKKLMGSMIAHLKNMIRGGQQKHAYVLKICSGHFPMNVGISNGRLTVKNFLGEKVPRILNLKQGADVKVEGDLIHVASTNKEVAGQISADIEQLTRRPGFDTRIFQDGIYIINKDGKELK